VVRVIAGATLVSATVIGMLYAVSAVSGPILATTPVAVLSAAQQFTTANAQFKGNDPIIGNMP
jgi:hypothetical protein